MVDVKTEGKERETDDLKSKLEEEDITAQTVGVEEVPSFVYLKQMPFQLPDLTDIPHEKLENYFLILSAIEQNLVEAKKIQAEIVQIFGEVTDLQEKARKEGILRNDTDDRQMSQDNSFLLTGGDLMSNLMEMESGKLFDSHKETLGSMLREGAKLISAAQKKSTDERKRSSLLTKFFNKE